MDYYVLTAFELDLNCCKLNRASMFALEPKSSIGSALTRQRSPGITRDHQRSVLGLIYAYENR